MNDEDEEDYDYDSVKEDCGESIILCEEDAKRQIQHYNNVLYRLANPLKIPGRCDPRSILYGL